MSIFDYIEWEGRKGLKEGELLRFLSLLKFSKLLKVLIIFFKEKLLILDLLIVGKLKMLVLLL